MWKTGDRVFAVLASNETQIWLLGFGLYLGDEPRPDLPADPPADLAQNWANSQLPLDEEMKLYEELSQSMVDTGRSTRADEDAKLTSIREQIVAERARPVIEQIRASWDKCRLNPHILLDDGRDVWGYQCWWGREERWEKFAAGREVIVTEMPA